MKKNILFLITFLNLSLFLQAQDSIPLLSVVDIPPLFEGCNDPLISASQRQTCSAPKIQAFIHQHITYPDSAKKNGIEGVVVVRFLVNEEGAVSHLKLIRDIGYDCGKEAMRVVRMMPTFTPALHNGKNVATEMTLPIRFRKIDESKNPNQNLYQLHWGTAYSNQISKKNLQNLLRYHLVVRDYYGNIYDIKRLKTVLVTKNKTYETKGEGNNLSKDSLKSLKKARTNHVVRFIAIIEKDYQEIEVVRELLIK